jgi:O-antigen ligase
LLGKDPTFTGRTFVWSMYFNSMMNTPFLGEGPGSYTFLSELTLPLALRLSDLGAIVTPHNAFLGAFGDAGIFGLFTFAGVLIYLAMIAPFLRSDRATLVCAGVAFFNMAHGMVETHEVFATGFAWFLMVFLRGMALRQEQEQQSAKAAPKGAVNAVA